jgi:hypothetical protein
VIEDPVPEEQSYASHRKPEDDLNVKGSTSRGLPRQTSRGSIGSLSRQSSGSSVIEAVTQSRPRPTPRNPSKTDTIPSDHFSERRTAEQVKQVVVPKEIQKLIFNPPKTEEDIPDLEPTLSLPSDDILAYREGESVSERAERLARDFPQEKPKFKVKTSDTARKVEEDKPETELQKELREKEEAERKRQTELVRQATERREEKKRRIAEEFKRQGVETPPPPPKEEKPPELNFERPKGVSKSGIGQVESVTGLESVGNVGTTVRPLSLRTTRTRTRT